MRDFNEIYKYIYIYIPLSLSLTHTLFTVSIFLLGNNTYLSSCVSRFPLKRRAKFPFSLIGSFFIFFVFLFPPPHSNPAIEFGNLYDR